MENEMETCEFCGRVCPVEGSVEVPWERSYMKWSRKGAEQEPIITIAYQSDPFASEIHGDETMYWQCESCAEQSYMEI